MNTNSTRTLAFFLHASGSFPGWFQMFPVDTCISLAPPAPPALRPRLNTGTMAEEVPLLREVRGLYEATFLSREAQNMGQEPLPPLLYSYCILLSFRIRRQTIIDIIDL